MKIAKEKPKETLALSILSIQELFEGRSTHETQKEQFHEINDLADTPAGKAIESYPGSLFVVASEKDALIPPTVTQGYIELAHKTSKKITFCFRGSTV
jgi:hypothetical protein